MTTGIPAADAARTDRPRVTVRATAAGNATMTAAVIEATTDATMTAAVTEVTDAIMTAGATEATTGAVTTAGAVLNLVLKHIMIPVPVIIMPVLTTIPAAAAIISNCDKMPFLLVDGKKGQ